MSDPLYVFCAAFAVSSLAGLAALLRADQPLGRKSVAAAMLNSGVLGLGISLLWYSQMQDNVYFLVGLCVVAGLGGMASVDFAVDAFKKVALTLLSARTGGDDKREGKS